jgi:hydrogenase maturation protease
MQDHSKLSIQRSNLILVVGYGSALRGDDAVGLRVAERVACWRLPGVHAVAMHQLAPELAPELATARLVIFVDAAPRAASGQQVGQPPHVLAKPIYPDPHLPTLGHAGDPCQLLALAEALYGVAAPAYLLPIPAESFTFGAPLSATAARGVRSALREIRRLLHEVSASASMSSLHPHTTTNNRSLSAPSRRWRYR